jgi:hypothetical protein
VVVVVFGIVCFVGCGWVGRLFVLCWELCISVLLVGLLCIVCVCVWGG